MIGIRQKISTYISIKRIIRFIKKSDRNSYTIGNEIATIYCLIYNNFKHMVDFNTQKCAMGIYNLLLNQSDYRQYYISKFLNKYVDFSTFFTILNTKILNLKNRYLWSYLRGYYINNLDISNTNLNISNSNPNDKKQSWFVLYDFHLHYLLFIYAFMIKDYKNLGEIDFLLNNCYDNYSINDVTDDLNYKMLFKHDPSKFNNSIKYILNLFYFNITSESQLFCNEDILTYRKYNFYLNN